MKLSAIRRFAGQQHGFVLMVGLLMLAVLSAIALDIARSALLQEKMVSASVHHLKAFNSAETAVRQSESEILAMDTLSGHPNLN